VGRGGEGGKRRGHGWREMTIDQRNVSSLITGKIHGVKCFLRALLLGEVLGPKRGYGWRRLDAQDSGLYRAGLQQIGGRF